MPNDQAHRLTRLRAQLREARRELHRVALAMESADQRLTPNWGDIGGAEYATDKLKELADFMTEETP